MTENIKPDEGTAVLTVGRLVDMAQSTAADEIGRAPGLSPIERRAMLAGASMVADSIRNVLDAALRD